MGEQLILDGHKLAWHNDRVQQWLGGERIAPITIDMALTRRCTYGCEFCYSKLQENDEKRMTKDVVYNFLDDCADIGVKVVSLISDGESTCSPHLYDAIIHGKENGLDMALGTNGYLLKQDKLEEIMPALTYLRFNMSAGEPKRYAEIHGVTENHLDKVSEVIKEAVDVKNKGGLETTIGLQMVLLPSYKDQISPLAKLGKELGVDYLVIKHCSDDEKGSLNVDYEGYLKDDLIDTIKEAEDFSDEDYLVKAKWSKILSEGKRNYKECYGAPFLLQMSGSGLIAACGALFNPQYEKHHIGNFTESRFKDIWKSDRYWKVMNNLHSEGFDARTDCACLCLQHKINEYLWSVKNGETKLEGPVGESPQHINFI